VTHKGKVTETFEDVDHMGRLRSAELATTVLGLRNAGNQSVVNNPVNVPPPTWAMGGSAKPQKPEPNVIEAEKNTQ